MPLFSIVGGLVVFAWSRRLYGDWGGLLSLALWVFCPNVLAHARLITTDMGSTTAGVAATYVFWRYLRKPSWRWAAAAGVALGAAQLTKFSMLLLYLVWPFFWLLRLTVVGPRSGWLAGIPRALAHGCAIVALSVLAIDTGYFFEGVGIPLGRFELGSRSLTRPVTPGMNRPRSKNELLTYAWQFRINRFRGTLLGNMPCPLPEHYVLGFDEQKLETEGIPTRFVDAVRADDLARARAPRGATDLEAHADNVARAVSEPETSSEATVGYTVYLNGVMRSGGWWYYYFLTLAYKVPEGTWILVLLGLAAARATARSREARAEELILWTVPAAMLFSISFLTDINLGLRYVLAIAPYVFIATGKVAPWILGMARPRKWVMGLVAAGSMGSTIAAAAMIHPHYLAYFNWMSGGPDRVPPRLIDSNLDWGQDLVALQRWWKDTIPGEPLGLAYFGQINPSIFAARGDPFSWFLPPVVPGTTESMAMDSSGLIGPARRLRPGYYAVSATIVRGLPWRFYDPAPPLKVPQAVAPVWNAFKQDAFGYFRQFEPIKKIGYSIYVYHLSKEDVAKVNP
jgi:4-amino-4-deoxy-L-arabinose transferase-like glycosyltransferase